jgi:hypothetical protein
MSGRLREALQRRLAGRQRTPAPVPSPTIVVLPQTTGQRVVRSPVFVMLVGVLVCFLLLLAMRPPFVLRKGDPAGKGVVPALLWSLVAGAIIIAIPTLWASGRTECTTSCPSS